MDTCSEEVFLREHGLTPDRLQCRYKVFPESTQRTLSRDTRMLTAQLIVAVKVFTQQTMYI